MKQACYYFSNKRVTNQFDGTLAVYRSEISIFELVRVNVITNVQPPV